MLNLQVKIADLKTFLEAHKKVISDKANMSFTCKNVFLSADTAHCVMITNNLDYGLKTSLPAVILNPGDILIDFERLYTYVKLADEDVIRIVGIKDADDNDQLKCKIGKLTILTAKLEDYPAWPSLTDNIGTTPEVDLDDFTKKLDMLKDCASTALDRFALTGFYIHSTQQCIVATNSYVLGKIGMPSLNPDLGDFIMQATQLKLLKELAKKSCTAKVTMSRDKDYFTIKTSCFEVYSRIIKALYPKYEELLPTMDFNTLSYKVPDVKALLKIIEKSAKIIKDNDQPETEFNFKDKKIKRHVKGIGTYEDDLPIEVENVPTIKGEPMELPSIHFSYYWLSIILKNMTSCRIGIFGELKPMLITDDQDQTYIIMPIRMDKKHY